MNKPVAWMLKTGHGTKILEVKPYCEVDLWTPLYTHPVINNGGNLEELNTKVQDASTSLESTPPINAEPVGRYYWESVADGHFMAVPSEGTIHYEIDDFPLYLHPVKELTPCEELRVFQEQQNGVFSEHNACCYRHECRIVWNDWEKLRSNPVKELTKNIADIWRMSDQSIQIVFTSCRSASEFEAILRKASEK